ncbi:transcriptional regulator [Bradyrhizobium macuxiense]|uniref:Transcriptional regulator n=1 Tax=Bradyrhizobium macuxiense TaxID=1755647 RepID=A0A109JGJ4_9BRAD|nr:TetR/AcrR family transcriptional regulator [Bradyrhizobium macuxiense]KWV48389.1 transcriptional regulator [Bradyrhizobium macuxiense]
MIETLDSPAVRRPEAPTGRKWDAVFQTARRLFLVQGFSATSTDAIAKGAGVSKATVYAYFHSKEELFASLIMAECERMQRHLVQPDLSEGLIPALRRFARQYVDLFIKRKDVAFVQLIANESGRFPELGRLFYESGPLATIQRLACFLDEAKARGLIVFEDSSTAATQFLNLVRGEVPLRTMLGLDNLTEETIDREIEAGLALFLRAYRPIPSS